MRERGNPLEKEELHERERKLHEREELSQ